MKNICNALSLMALMALWPITAGAAIIEITGDVVIIDPPSSVATGQLESNSQIALFQERQHVTLETDLLVDVRNPGTYGPNANLNTFPQDGSIPAGTMVHSYYLHADQVGVSGSTTFIGTVTFDKEILGIAFTAQRQSDTVVLLGLPGTIYDSAQIGVQSSDQFVLGNDRRTISFRGTQGSGADNLRVITTAPEPSTFAILAIGGLALLRHRVAQKRSI